jgi:hypothetical protein
MNGEFASVSCELEAVACSTETATGTANATLGQRLGKGWAQIWNSLARMWTDLLDKAERMWQLCETLPVACDYPL